MAHELFIGHDVSENHKEKKQTLADKNYLQYRENQKNLKQGKGNRAQKNEQQFQQTQEQGQQYQTKPMFIQLLRQNEEDITIDLEQYLDQEYPKDGNIKYFDLEKDYGDTEYKLLVDPDQQRLIKLTTQMNYRLTEGKGVAYYKIGVEDSGHPKGLQKKEMICSINNLCQMALSIKAEVLLMSINQAKEGKTAELMVRRAIRDGVKLDIRILMLGESGSGKTSLLGVLSTGQLDNGNGLARAGFLKNEQELTSGKTGRMVHVVIGLNSEGRIVNHQNNFNFSHESTMKQVVEQSTKLITFIDIGGTKKAQNQMIKIVNSQIPDYAFLAISAEYKQLSKNHIEILQMLQIQQIPFIIGLTFIDKVSEDDVFDLIRQIKEKLHLLNHRGIPLVVKSQQDLVSFSQQIQNANIIPIFKLSNLRGDTLQYFINFLNILPSTNKLISNSNHHVEYCIHNLFDVSQEEKGFKVLGGTVLKGVIRLKQILHIGPDKKGSFFPCEIEEIQCNRVQVKSAQCGQICTVKFKLSNLAGNFGTEQNPIRVGQVLIDSKTNPQAVWDFVAEIWLLDNEKKEIKTSFEPVINTQSTRQICRIIKDELDELPDLILEKQVSKSIDAEKQRKKSFGSQFRKQSDQISQAKKIQSNLSPNRRNKSQNQKKKIDDLGVRQLFRINEKLDKPQQETFELLPNQPNNVRLKFKYYPEYITKGMRIIINDQNLKAWGWIRDIKLNSK